MGGNPASMDIRFRYHIGSSSPAILVVMECAECSPDGLFCTRGRDGPGLDPHVPALC